MVGIGIDVVAVARIAALLAKHGDRFRWRCFRAQELALARQRKQGEAAALAARWAAKEAFLKALGRSTAGISLRDIEVRRPAGGPPSLQLHDTAAAALRTVAGATVHLSLSHEDEVAVAVVLVE